MARFDVYQQPDAALRRTTPFLLDVQNTHISGIATRVVVPLRTAHLVALPMRDLLHLGRHVPALEALLLHAAGAEVSRLNDNPHLMAAPSSEVRVVRFLLQFARRQAALGHSGRRLRMCMTRVGACAGGLTSPTAPARRPGAPRAA